MKTAIFAMEITDLLSKDLLEKTGRVYEIFVSDLVPNYFCDATPLYSMESIRIETEKRVDDGLDTEMMTWCDDTYMHASSAMELHHEVSEDYDDFEDFKEYHRCNHDFSYVPVG